MSREKYVSVSSRVSEIIKSDSFMIFSKDSRFDEDGLIDDNTMSWKLELKEAFIMTRVQKALYTLYKREENEKAQKFLSILVYKRLNKDLGTGVAKAYIVGDDYTIHAICKVDTEELLP